MFLWAPALLFAALLAADDCRSVWERGREAYQAKQFTAAARELERALSVCPRQAPVLLDLAKAQLMAEELEACRTTVRKLLAIDSRNAAALKLQADAEYLAGDDRQAEQSLLLAIDIDPKNEDAIYSLGRVYYHENRFEQAIARFERVLQLNPKSYKAYDNLGLCYEALNKDDEAIRQYLKALELVYKDHQDYDWPYANLANLMINRGEYKKAFDLGVEAARRNPSSARNFYLTAKALSNLDQLDLSVKWLKQSISLDPNYPEPHYLLARVYRRKGLADEAQRELNAFQELAAKRPRLLR